MPSLHDIFSYVCGQQHNWAIAGQDLPFCQRCTGLYVGAMPALLAFLLFRPKPGKGMLWTHGMFLLLMVPFGYHWVAQGAEIRMLTGQIFAAGLVYYFALMISDVLGGWSKSAPANNTKYFAILVLAVVVLQFSVHWGGWRTYVLLSWLGFVGLLLYGALASLNVLLLASAVWQKVRFRARYLES